MIEVIPKEHRRGPRILVAGIGGGGNNALNRLCENKTRTNIDTAAINTDMMVLDQCASPTRLQIGEKLTGGYGAGADPSVGEAAAMENEEEIRELVSDYNMLILTCGMGGGTGTGATPVVARIAQEAGVLVVAVVTTPFQFESMPRLMAAEAGVSKLEEHVDTLLVIPNDKLLTISEKPLKLDDAFLMADSVLKYTIEGITNIVYYSGVVNLDFNDLKTTLLGKGIGHLGLGIIDEETPVIEAVKQAINSPLLDTTIVGASNILLNSSGNVDVVSLNEAISYVRETAGMNVNLLWGTVNPEDPEYEGKIVITLIATGMPKAKPETPAIHEPVLTSSAIAEVKAAQANQANPYPFRLNNDRVSIKIPSFLSQGNASD